MQHHVELVRPTLEGRTLGERYLLQEQLARGAEGDVYLATNVLLDVLVVVKVLRPDLAVLTASRIRFRHEATLAGGISHPNIVTVVDFGESPDGILYLVMERVLGRSLRELVRAEGAQPIGRVASIMLGLTAALAELHHGGVAHGDVNSENLLLHTTGDGAEQLKVVDFGLAARISGPGGEPDRGIWGTPGYLAPEVILGSPPSAAADMYACGVVFYELLTGELPFEGVTTQQLMENQLTRAVVPPSVRAPGRGITAAFDALIGLLLATFPGERPAAAVLSAALAAVPRAGRLAVPRSPGLGPRFTTLRTAAPHVRPAPGMLKARRADPSTPEGRVDWLRAGIGRAVRSGDVDQLVDLYLGLAALLVENGNTLAAEMELDEAVALATQGGGQMGESGPVGLWRLLLMLAELKTLRGQTVEARMTLAHAYRHADRVGSSRGRAETERQARAEDRARPPQQRFVVDHDPA